MNELTVFSNTEFGEIRTIMIGNEPFRLLMNIPETVGDTQ